MIIIINRKVGKLTNAASLLQAGRHVSYCSTLC